MAGLSLRKTIAKAFGLDDATHTCGFLWASHTPSTRNLVRLKAELRTSKHYGSFRPRRSESSRPAGGRASNFRSARRVLPIHSMVSRTESFCAARA